MGTYRVVTRDYRRGIEHPGGDCAVEAEPAPCPPEDAPVLWTTSGFAVIEDGIAISRFDCDPPDVTNAGRIRQLRSWLAAHVRVGHPR